MGFPVLFNIFAFCLIPIGQAQMQPSNRPCASQSNYAIYDGTCKHYYTCVFDGIEFQSYDLTCPDSMVFHPVLGYCVSPLQYACEQTTSTSVSTAKSTSTSPTLDPPACNETGRYPMRGTYCKDYYFCIVFGRFSFEITYLSCPNTLVFDPTIQLCVLPSLYNCTDTS